MAAAADARTAPAGSGPAEPADLAKPLDDPLPPPQAPAEVADPIAEPPQAGSAAEADLPVPQILAPAPDAGSLPMPITAADCKIEHDIFAIIVESRAALARGVEAMSDELASFARNSIDATADSAIQMLAITTWSDAVAVNARFARTSYGQWLDSTAKVSELGVNLAYESARPWISGLGQIWRITAEGR